MSRFSDFDDFLIRQKKQQEQTASEYREKILFARQTIEPLLRDVFLYWKDYTEEVLLPRKEVFAILKKSEELPYRIPEKQVSIPYFMYRMNIIPRDLFSQAYTPSDSLEETYVTPNKITKYDWHPKVALQVTLALEDRWNEKTNQMEEALFPVIRTRIWDTLPTERGALLLQSMQITSGKDFRLPYTEITATLPDTESAPLLEVIKSTFLVVTPQVLAHEKFVFGLEQ